MNDRIKLFAQIAVSLIVLIAALYMLISPSINEDAKKWSVGALGVLLGYWIR